MENTYLHSRAPARLARRREVPRRAPARSDAELLTASIRDPDAFTELFQRHWEDLYRFCLHRAGAAGEDIAAEAFRIAFDRRLRYDTRYPDARPWLFGITANVLREHFRAARREESKRERSAALNGAPGASTDLGELERALLGPELADALQGIPAADRDALLLLAWADLDYEQIGQALGIPLGTVRSRIHRARRRLRAYLDTNDGRHAHTNEA
jgi:RNA polymerase sigma factor (sigma-70 family)